MAMNSYAQVFEMAHNISDDENMRREGAWWKVGIEASHGWYEDTAAAPDTYIFTFKTTFLFTTTKIGAVVLDLAERGYFRFEIGKKKCPVFFDVVTSAPLDYPFRIDFACSVSTSLLVHGCSQTVSLVATVPTRFFNPGLQTLEPYEPKGDIKWDTRLLIAAMEGSEVLRVFDLCEPKRYYGPYGCIKSPTWPLDGLAPVSILSSPAFSDDSGIGGCSDGSLTSRFSDNPVPHFPAHNGDSNTIEPEQLFKLPLSRYLTQPAHNNTNTASLEGQIQPKFGNERRPLGFTSHHLLEDNTKHLPLEGGSGTTFHPPLFSHYNNHTHASSLSTNCSTNSVAAEHQKPAARRRTRKRPQTISSSRSSISSRSSSSDVSISDVDSAVDLRSARNTVAPEDHRETKQANSVSPRVPRQVRMHQGTLGAYVCPVCKEKFKDLRSHQILTKHTKQASQSMQKSGRGSKDGLSLETPTTPENTARESVGNVGAKLDISLVQTPRVYAPEQDAEIPLSDYESNRDQTSTEHSSADNFAVKTCEIRLDSDDSACGADSPDPEYWDERNTRDYVTLFGAEPDINCTVTTPNDIDSPSCNSQPSTPAQNPFLARNSLAHLQQQHAVPSPSPQAPTPGPTALSVCLSGPDGCAPADCTYNIPITPQHDQSPVESKNGAWGRILNHKLSEGARTVETLQCNLPGTESWLQNIPSIRSIGVLDTPGEIYESNGSSFDIQHPTRSTVPKRPLTMQGIYPEKDETDRHLESPVRRSSVSIMTDSSASTNSTPAKSDKLGTPSTALTTPQTVSDMGSVVESPLFTRSPAEHTSARGTNTGLLPNVFSRTGGHARVWIRKILPWVNSNFEKIMGEENAGAIEFVMLGPDRTPTVCVTAEDETKVDRNVLDLKLSHVDVYFEIKIQQGDVGRTGGNNRPAVCYEWPSLNSEFQPLPSCGASIGVGNNTGTFGGLVQLKFGNEWKVFGLTSHHLFESRTKDTPIGKGVKDGRLNDAIFEISQPSQHHLQYSIGLLERSLQTHIMFDEKKKFKGVSLPTKDSNQEKISKRLKDQKKLTSNSNFGRVVYSSGFGRTVDVYPDSLAEEMDRPAAHTMDWALFGNIPNERVMQVNCVSKALAGAFYEDGDPITTTVSAEFFEGLASEELPDYPDPEPDVSAPEPYCRVHGVGAMSGLMDGYLSTVPGCIKLERFGSHSIEWSFAPRDPKGGLGKRGDSGAWIFDDFGSVVGMILGRNDHTGLTYFTPIDAIFKDIKETLGFDVRLAKPFRPSYEALLSHELQGTGGVSWQHSQPQLAVSTSEFPVEDFYSASGPWDPIHIGNRNNPFASLMPRPEPPYYVDFATPGRDSAIGIPCTPVDSRKRKNSEAGDRASKRPTMTSSQNSIDSYGCYDVQGREGLSRPIIKREPDD